MVSIIYVHESFVRLFLPFGGSGRGSGARVRVFFSGIARIISAHDRTGGHYYAKAVRETTHVTTTMNIYPTTKDIYAAKN